MDSLITEEYRDTLRKMHKKRRDWGASAHRFLKQIFQVIDDANPALTVLDYGCGKAVLEKDLETRYPHIEYRKYDPGIEKYSQEPTPCDVVICTDVLEHVEPELIDNVLDHLAGMVKEAAYIVIYTGDCGHKLPDGRAAHLIQQDRQWWETKLMEAFLPRGFQLSFADTGLPKRFQVIVRGE